jgi:molybdopterin molybdotransferase
MLTIEEALSLVRTHVQPLAPRQLSLGDAAELVLAEDITSDVDSPPYDKALMDGYAVRSTDHEPERSIIEEIPAGAVPRYLVTAGAASRIMTGAPMPQGADAVVPLEQTELLSQQLVRLATVDISAGVNTLAKGASLRIGDRILQSGTLIRPIEVTVLAEIGRSTVAAIPRPRVAVLPTGNELVAAGEKPGFGQIRNSNGPMLVAMAKRAGAEAAELGIAKDDPDDLRKLIQEGVTADVLLLSGGVSAGKFDLVPQVLNELGVEQVFHKVSLRPGKPLWFGVRRAGDRQTLVFALPGNPVSSLVCFELFVRPAIAALAGRGFTEAATARVSLGHPFEHAGGRAAYLPARLTIQQPHSRLADKQPDSTDNLTVEILPWQGSADIATLTRANALAIFGIERQSFRPGDQIEIIQI